MTQTLETLKSERIKIYKTSPELYDAMMVLSNAAAKDIDPELGELIKIRASQINHCAFCLDMHTRDARKHGVSEQKLDVLAAWEEAGDLFTERERAALALTEAITHVADEPCSRRRVRTGGRGLHRTRARSGHRNGRHHQCVEPHQRDRPHGECRGADTRGVQTRSGAEIVVDGDVVYKLHRPGTDPRALTTRLRIAAESGSFLSPLEHGARSAWARRGAPRWPRVETVVPEPDYLPWAEAGQLLARLHAESVPPRTPVHGWPQRLRRAVDALRSRPNDDRPPGSRPTARRGLAGRLAGSAVDVGARRLASRPARPAISQTRRGC